MAPRELLIIADLKSATFLYSNKHLTLGFDATTKEGGTHFNEIHVTSSEKQTDAHGRVTSSKKIYDVLSIEELPRGTALDYHEHIVTCIGHLAYVYANASTSRIIRRNV